MEQKAIIKTIRLYPTLFCVDVWICNDLEQLSKCFHKRYGAKSKYYKKILTPNQTCIIDSTDESELKGHRRIVVNMSEYDVLVLAHEIVHVLYKLNKCTDLELTKDSQEWQAYLTEYILEQSINKKSYKKYKLNGKNN
jgi:hypothetical protein